MIFRTKRLLPSLASSLAIAGLALSLALPAGRARAADQPAAPAAAIPAAKPAASAPAKPVQDPNVGSFSGLPLPRFVSLRADAVNMRVGPGDQYPILWVYHRVGLPVEILREYDVWRLVIDSDGTKGWMHEATLMGRRDFVINGTNPVTLYRRPTTDAASRAQLMPGVVGAILRCDAGSDWCRVRVNHVDGWLQRSNIWGLLPNEKLPAK